MICDADLVSEAGDEEESRGEEEDHEGGAGLSLPQSSIDHHLVEPPQLGCQCLVLALKSFDLLLEISELQLQLNLHTCWDLLVTLGSHPSRPLPCPPCCPDILSFSSGSPELTACYGFSF